jgi:hypothetical protein
MAPSFANPPVANTQARSKPPPMSERMTLMATEFRGGHTVRTRRLVIAQVSAEPRAQSAPIACGERMVTAFRYLTRVGVMS